MATRSKAHIGGHPLHPMLVPIPIGLFAWSLVSLIVYAASDSNMTWYDMSYWSAIGGIIAAVVAALPGLIDGFGVAAKTEAKGLAMGHMLLNAVVTALFVIAAIMMRDDGAIEGAELGTALALQGVGIGLLLLSGWLGGEMVFRHHIGMTTDSRLFDDEVEARHTATGKAQPR